MATKKATPTPTREQCIEDVRQLQASTGQRVTRSVYRSKGNFKEAEWSQYFEKFSDLVAAAEGTISVPTKEDCLADLRRVAREYTESPFTRGAYRQHGAIDEIQWQRHFPTFESFREAAGIAPNKKTAAEQVAEELIFKQNYTYNEATDTYITFLKTHGTNIVLSGERHRALKQRYSSMIDKASTINEICRDFGMPRPYFIAYKSAHGWTHDQDPFTKEEHESRDTDDMVQELEQMSRFTVQKEFQKKKWVLIQTKAKKWDEFEQSVLEPLVGAIEAGKHQSESVPRLQLDKAKQPYALILSPADLHYGKSAWRDETGEAYSREEARKLLLYHTQRITHQVAAFGKPDKIIVASGSDWFHIDNPDSKTTSGTPQDCDGSYAQILTEGCELAQEHLDLLRQIAPIEFLTAPGNHDRYSALTLNLYLRAIYKDAKDVTMLSSPLPRQYTSYGNSLLGFGHGDTVKIAALHGVMTQEAEEQWKDSKFRYYFTGHFHHRIQEEVNGIVHFSLSSLSGADRWHKQQGYITSSRSLQGFVVSKDSGIIAELISPVTHNKGLRGVKVKQNA